jgi:carbon monoxide dehydrogenase subunit G
MEVLGRTEPNASREDVWAALNNPELMRQSMPWCQTLEKSSDSEFAATVALHSSLLDARLGQARNRNRTRGATRASAALFSHLVESAVRA